MAYTVTYRPRQQSFAVHNETVKLYRKNQKAHHSYLPCNAEIISAKKKEKQGNCSHQALPLVLPQVSHLLYALLGNYGQT